MASIHFYKITKNAIKDITKFNEKKENETRHSKNERKRLFIPINSVKSNQ